MPAADLASTQERDASEELDEICAFDHVAGGTKIYGAGRIGDIAVSRSG